MLRDAYSSSWETLRLRLLSIRDNHRFEVSATRNASSRNASYWCDGRSMLVQRHAAARAGKGIL
jgi:hypothetical protein